MPTQKTQLAIIGAGPGGYAAAFRAADLGLQVTLIDLDLKPGGVCLSKGCIPSKALLHAAKMIEDSKEAQEIGIQFTAPQIDLSALRSWKNSVVEKLMGGLAELCRQRKIEYIQGCASFEGPHLLFIQKESDSLRLEFEQAVIATGSSPFVPKDWKIKSPHLWTSTEALELREIPKKLLVIGGGYIGLEMGSVYSALGSKVSVVEMASQLLPSADRDLARVLMKKIESRFETILTKTKVQSLAENPQGLTVQFQSEDALEQEMSFDKVLVAMGRSPNIDSIGLEKIGITLDAGRRIFVNAERRTSISHIFAIGDVAGEPMLAHKATHEGIVAAEVAAGHAAQFDPKAIPAIIYTDPEIAWCGLTESQAREQKREVLVSRFPWTASGRALTLNRSEGVTKIMTDPETDEILGVGMVGVGAGDLIAEAVLAMEMGATAFDLANTIHPHPTLSETLMEAAEGIHGLGLHLYRPKRDKK
ncbi:MAG: dihydrolipoyl dehydrogenase [Deltaproteobacteria bacterium]|nr:dihydrolipoyl dehydrogenase [Deltaproteobacteria bacterium]